MKTFILIVALLIKARIDKNIQKYNCFYTHALHDSYNTSTIDSSGVPGA